MVLPLDRFVNLVQFFALENADAKERTRFEVRLNRPQGPSMGPVPETSPWSKANEERSLSGLSAALRGA